MRVYEMQKGSSYDPDAEGGPATTWPLRHELGPKNLEPGYQPYPFSRPAVVIAAPAVIQTGAVGANPWDHQFGPVGSTFALPMAALAIPPQIGRNGF